MTALMALAACAQPTTQRPNYTPTELQREKAEQERAAKIGKINFNDKKSYSAKQIQEFAARVDAVADPVEKSATELCRILAGSNGKCMSRVVLAADKKGLNAHADGKDVVIYPAMIDFAKNDNHLAFVIAHEFAHNIMRHQSALQKNVTIGALLGVVVDVAAGAGGVNTEGAFTQAGAQQGQLSYSPEFEHEADYIGLYILARAGYSINDAPMFWRVMSQANPDSIYIASTHPTNPARTIQMEKTVQEIHAKQRAGAPLVPNIKPKK
jgi:predicted Zn-dependent protease